LANASFCIFSCSSSSLACPDRSRRVVVVSGASPRWGFDDDDDNDNDDEDDDPSTSLRAGYDDDRSLRGLT